MAQRISEVSFWIALMLVAISSLSALAWSVGIALLVVGARFVRQRRAERQERARLLADCHSQHAALMKGGSDDTWAFFGRHIPDLLDQPMPAPRWADCDTHDACRVLDGSVAA